MLEVPHSHHILLRGKSGAAVFNPLVRGGLFNAEGSPQPRPPGLSFFHLVAGVTIG